MDYVRSKVLRRGTPAGEQETDLEHGHPRNGQQMQEQEQSPGRARRFVLGRPQLPSVFSGQPRHAIRLQRSPTNRDDEDGPKTRRFRVGLPNLSRTGTRSEQNQSSSHDSSSVDSDETESRPSLQRSRTERFPVVVEPQLAHSRRDSTSGRSRRSFRGADPAEMHLADLAETGRRRRRRNGSTGTQQRGQPKRFLYCFPWIKSRRVRSQVLRCFVLGMFLSLMLIIYLALSVTKNINNSEFTILLILVILFATIVFCHGLIRLCMIVMRPKSPDDEERARLPEMMGPGGYAVPKRPIRVLLARDEEAAGLESETTKVHPPAYGLWRESVRVDPNRIYWQRNDQEPVPLGNAASRPATANRPPSYASDDGVDYVVEARPRSMAPLSDATLSTSGVPLPTHPSEAGRIGQGTNF
ncbi:hypothetical protein BKA67DRAFT_662091 [Truncatella angustata]|uniref:Uncharacterized protein n=1 Tax=Truncatella angustata TaxID=152316 RepID=A0A9P8ZUP9_9PEZI|nr:uncharacterized protein BKA67DRAFT_662091 [Truncatella angustata]KAH6649177.1 hypothetical protein BKA67DRAFT_662091 [Truncatella angustata]